MLEVKGFREAEQGMLKIVIDLPPTTQETLEKTAREIVDEAKRMVPVRTGRLRDSIGIGEVRKGSVEVKADAFYAGWVEFGSSKMIARPYMRPAIMAKVFRFAEAITQRLSRL